MKEPKTKYGYPLEEVDGHLCIGITRTNEKGASDASLGVNWIRYYDLPEPDNLAAHLKLLQSLELRFKTHVARGSEIKARDVDRLVGELDAAKEAGKPQDIIDTMSGDVAIALQKRSFNLAEEYFELRIKGGRPHDNPKAKAALTRAVESFTQAFSYAGSGFTNIRREDGSLDRDNAIGEMLTEGMHILNGARPEGRGSFESIFHKNRFHKASKAWDEINRVAEAAKQVIAQDPVLSAAEFKISDEKSIDFSQMFEDLQVRATQRAHMMRSDPEFYQQDVALRATQNALMRFKLPALDAEPTTEVIGTGKFTSQMAAAAASQRHSNTEESYYLMRAAVRLIYDMAEIRHGRHQSTKEYVAETKAFLAKDKGGPSPFSPLGTEGSRGWYMD